MKVICSKNDLNANLSLASRAVPSRPIHPILANVLFVADAERERVSLTAFDLSLSIQTNFNAQVLEGGSITLPAKLLNDIVTRLPDGEITLSGDTEANEDALITLTSASGCFQIRGMSAAEFPELPEIENGYPLMLPVSALTEGLRGTLFGASTEEIKQILTGVHLTHDRDFLEFAATDSHRLAVVQIPDETATETKEEGPNEPNIEDFRVTIPARALKELERMLAMRQESDTVGLHIDENQVVFELAEQCLTSRKLDGVYPAYQKLIPDRFSRQITLERKRLLSGLELVAVLAGQNNNIIKFSINAETQQLSLSVDARDLGSATESMSAQITGESIDIAFNAKYLMDGLKALPASEIQMQLNEPNQPVIFTPLGGIKMTYLVMPVQIRD